MNQRINRRQFLGATAVAGAGISLPWPVPAQPQKTGTGAADKPALLGGKPVRTRPPRAWPIFDEREEQALQVLRKDTVTITLDFKSGGCAATAWGCDLSYDYVKINADYRT